MSKRNQNKKRTHKVQHTPSNAIESSVATVFEPGTPEWQAADDLVQAYQSGANSIRAGREKVGYKLGDLWNDWYNSLMVICFTLGGALIAVATAIKFKVRADLIIFWIGDCLFLLNGVYILLLRKSQFERESSRAITMGYEIEYYSLVAKNRVLDVMKGKKFKQTEYEEAKDKLLGQALGELDNAYEETGKVEEHMDVMTALFIGSLELLVLSSISNTHWLKIAGIIAVLIFLALLIVLRAGTKQPKEAIQERNNWLEKIKPERSN